MKILMKRGLKSNLPALDVAEFGFCTDTKEVYIGSSTGNVLVNGGGGGGGGTPPSGTPTEDLVIRATDGKNYEIIIDENGAMTTSVTTKVASVNVKHVVNVQGFGAKGDYNPTTGIGTDDTLAIQNAIDSLSATGGIVFFPVGNYKISSSLILYSNIIIEGEGSATKIFIMGTGYLFKGEGTFGTDISFSTDKGFGDTVIDTLTAHGLAVGDLALVKSQRDALSDDAGENWKLGYATPSVTGCFFGEFSRILQVNTTTKVTLTSGLIFPSYRKDKTQEVSTTARNSSTICKFNPIENVIIRDIHINGSPSRAISFKQAYQCSVDNMTFELNNDGIAVIFENSFMCEAKNCKGLYDASNPPADHFTRNTYKTVSSHLCGFVGCYVENATQAFDFTYNTGGTPSLFSYVVNCETKGAENNGMTSHGGCYAITVQNNRFLECLANGIAIRTRSSIITNNTVSGTRPMDSTYGIALYEGYARDCIISDNSIIGFLNATEIIDGVDAGELFQWVGSMFSNNTITNCNTGLLVARASTNKYSGDTGITFKGNTMKNMTGTYGKGVSLDPYVADVRIYDNVIDGTGAFNGGVYAQANTTKIYIDNNHFTNCSNVLWLLQPTDVAVFPTLHSSVFIGDGNIYTGGVLNKLDANVDVMGVPNHFGSFHPYKDGVGQIGWSSRRWASIMAQQVNADKYLFTNTITSASASNNSIFVDSADNKLKFKDSTGAIKIVNLT